MHTTSLVAASRIWRSVVLAAFLAAGLSLSAPADAAAARLSAAERVLYAEVFDALERGKPTRARQLLARGRHPVANKVLLWSILLDRRTAVGFQEVVDFVSANPDWPRSDRLLQRAESVIPKVLSDAAALDHFERFPPATLAGRERLARALMARGDRPKAVALLRSAWIAAPGRTAADRSKAKRYATRHRATLRPADHLARVENLLWQRQWRGARDMAGLLDPGAQRLAEAWAILGKRRSTALSVETALARVPAAHRNHPGLLQERANWHHRNEENAEARSLLHRLAQAPAVPDHGARVWRLRDRVIRRALETRDYADAYDLARGHGLAAGKWFAEATFLSGWIALRFRNDAASALRHFEALYDGVKYPISRARAAYWAGRAADALSLDKLASDWFDRAAEHPTTYYGQLAARRVDRQLVLPPPKPPSATDRAVFEGSDLMGAIRILEQLEQDRRQMPFFLALLGNNEDPGVKALVPALALESGNLKAAVRTAKRVLQSNGTVLPSGYPVLAIPNQKSLPDGDPEDALVLALMRQESEFDTRAVSPVGARGLMQLMPYTAKRQARDLRVKYRRTKLTRDPEYNMLLGRAYLSGRLAEFGNHYAMALAGYNAGPHRVDQWRERFGDPRDTHIDVIDWVELIPFRETRNYVQRVLESLQIYRARLGTGPLTPADPRHMFGPLRPRKRAAAPICPAPEPQTATATC